MPTASHLEHYAILTAMLAPALLMAATASLLMSANARLARVVDRLRNLIAEWKHENPDRREREDQIRRHRQRAKLVLRACQMLYLALASFVGTSLMLAIDAFTGSRLGPVPTVMAIVGVSCLLGASFMMWREITLSVNSFELELDHELGTRQPAAKS